MKLAITDTGVFGTHLLPGKMEVLETFIYRYYGSPISERSDNQLNNVNIQASRLDP